MENKKLTWQEIAKLYDREWVQFVNYDWIKEDALPSAGVVQAHATTRRELDELIIRDPQKDSALLFAGERNVSSGVVSCASHQLPI